MAVNLLTEFPARPESLSPDTASASRLSDPATVSQVNLGRRAGRPVAVAPRSVACFRGLFYAVSFEAVVALAGVGIWEAWRLLR